MNTDLEEQEDELLALQSIFGSEEFLRSESKSAGEFRVSVELPAGFTVLLKHGGTIRQYDVSFLPPLILTFELPGDYPSSAPPSFTLTCSWLTQPQLTSLSDQLTDLYQATGGAVVLFSWIQFLREEALKQLDIHNLLELPSDQNHSSSAADSSELPASVLAVQEVVPPNENQSDSGLSLTASQILLSQILIHDAEQKQKVFAATPFDCGVCFSSRLGSECVQLYECGHIFCLACLDEFWKAQITEGNVRGVTCPQVDCSATPTPAQVKSLVGEELFHRYDRLLLQSTLDVMPGMPIYNGDLLCKTHILDIFVLPFRFELLLKTTWMFKNKTARSFLTISTCFWCLENEPFLKPSECNVTNQQAHIPPPLPSNHGVLPVT
ncbi:E3 ubiquitin-protein ligase RNF14-like [Xiphophorus hellerii]|uniref:E3 ubiquitin-protein ligase RNF14-like n=1 Tax=Xiphophorus hellerii TaxID=8084 RepID=UPI0013B3C58C|nr:E3 ubiquitin-protein ligase RNF14-like [Xiphophorus hellerii]